MEYQRTLSSDPAHSEGDSPHKAMATSRSSSSMASPRRVHRIAIWKAHLLMFGVLLIASAICVAHHVFLSILNGRNVEDFAISQTWVRDIGNALAWIVHFLLQISVGVALTQTIWLYVRGSRVTLDDLDTLFSLPAFFTLPSTLFQPRVLFVLILVIVLQGLPLVGIFAPNALSVVPAHPINSSLRVPVPALDRIPATTSTYFLQDGSSPCGATQCESFFYYMNPSSSFQRLARGVLDGGTIFPWSPPSGCGRGCSYDVDYWGPALKCTEIPQSSIDVFSTEYTSVEFDAHNATVDPSIQVSNPTHYLQGAYVYNATTSFGFGVSWTIGTDLDPSTLIPIFQSNPYGQPFSLDVVYATNHFTMPFRSTHPVYYDTTGYTCAFHNASYRASVNYSNGSQTTATRIMEYGAQLGPISDPGSLNASDVNGTGAEFLSTYAALSLADAMSQYVYGTIGFSSDEFNDYAALAPVYTNVLSSILTTPTSFAGGSTILTLSLVSTSYDNMGQLLEDACTNLTASLMSDAANLGLYAQVPAIIIPDADVYRYQASRLWLVYGIALSLSLLVDVYGLVCILKNGGAMERTFSAIAASMRSRELDTLLNEPGEPLPPRAQTVKLRYRAARSVQVEGERAGFVIARHEDDGDVEVFETAALKDEERS